MTEACVAATDERQSESAGTALGGQVRAALGEHPPDVLILFASSQYNYQELLHAVDAACHPRLLVGCSSAGEFTSRGMAQGSACAVALRAPEMRFSACIGHGLRSNRGAAVEALVSMFRGLSCHDYIYRSALVLTDALAGYADELVEQITLLTAGTYQLFGGGAGDDARFEETHLFFGTEAYTDAVVALEILSNKPLGVGVCHAWQPAGPAMRVTEAESLCLVSLNAMPAVEAFQMHAERVGQPLDPSDPTPFFLHNIIGIESGEGYRLRVPLGIRHDGAVACAADIPVGAKVNIMAANTLSSAEAAAAAIRSGLERLGSHRPKIALFFDCVATRLRMGQDFGSELQALQRSLGTVPYAGFNTYGQVARAEGQFSGFHNCTAVVCIIPE